MIPYIYLASYENRIRKGKQIADHFIKLLDVKWCFVIFSACMICSCFWVRVWKALCYWHSHSTLLKTHRLCTKIIRVWPFQRPNTSVLWEYFDLYKQFPSIQEAIFRVQCTCLIAMFCHRNETIHTSSNLPLQAKEDMMANTKCTTPLWYQLIQVCSVNPILPSAVSTKINITLYESFKNNIKRLY